MRIRTKRLAGLGAIAAATGLAVAAVVIVPSSAEEEPDPIAVHLLTPRGEFTDDIRGQLRLKLDGRGNEVINMKDASRTVVAEITVQPGAMFPWHTHHGPVIVNVAQGGLTYVYADDCVERPYPAGTVFVDPGRGNVHTAFNQTDEVTVVYATFFEAPASGPLTITEGVTPPTDCHIEVGTHTH